MLFSAFLYSISFTEIEAQTTTVPDKPTNLQAFDVSPTRIDLFWSTPQNNGGSAITGYKIEYKTADGSYTNLVANTGNATTKYSHTGLTTQSTYIYRVSAINSIGASSPSSEAVATPKPGSQPLENIPPNSPTSLSAVDISSTSNKLTWIQPASNNGPPVIGYKIEVKIESGSYTTLVANTGNTVTTYTHSSLTTNTKYTYKVSAINSVGTSSTSNESTATPKTTSTSPTQNIAPNPPRSFKAESGGPTKIVLSWAEPLPNDGPDVTGYKIEFKTSGNYTVLADPGLSITYTHNDLTENTQYSYRIYAINPAGTSVASSVVSAKPIHTTIPTNLVADDISPTEILLTWTAPSQTYGSNIVGYTIQKQFSPGVYDTVKETNDKNTSYTLTGLTTGTSYTYVVKARFSMGTSTDVSNTATATPTLSSKPPSQFKVPGAPTGLTATAVSPIQINLLWNAPVNDGGSPITGYRIDVKVGTGNYVTLTSNTGSTSKTYSHVERTPDVTYTYKVYAVNTVGASSASNEASATPTASSTPPQPDTKPNPPTSLIATAVSQNQINLSWKAPTNDGGKTITGYKIEVKIENGAFNVLSADAGRSTTFSHTGLKSDTIYHYRVSAINSIGTSSPSSETSTKTLPEKEKEPIKNIPDFVDPKQGAKYYLDRYNTEPAYKEWFDTNYPDYTIEEAIELAIPGAFTVNSTKPILSFVDPKQDPQYYINRYNTEPAYKEWFDTNYPGYTIYEAVGVSEQEPVKEKPPEPPTGECGPGTIWVEGYCEATKNNSGGGCLIATATYGSELAIQVQSLRELRDTTLLQTNSGSIFMDGFNQFYYSFSPTIADIERENPIFKEAVKITITPMITSLSILNYVDIDSESEVLSYGIGIILLNIGMYFVLPTFALLAVRRNLWHKNLRK
ncbi:MAG TPA: fibronectin type III domain-containing protein [Nitrosopumilaceae archaeon]|nr:fibronectin type III domain-containing protein [Nitrosopumilaceae archaeon]